MPDSVSPGGSLAVKFLLFIVSDSDANCPPHTLFSRCLCLIRTAPFAPWGNQITPQARMYHAAHHTIDGFVREPTQRYVVGTCLLLPCPAVPDASPRSGHLHSFGSSKCHKACVRVSGKAACVARVGGDLLYAHLVMRSIQLPLHPVHACRSIRCFIPRLSPTSTFFPPATI